MRVANGDSEPEDGEVSIGIELLWKQLQGMLYRRALMLKRTPTIWTRMFATYVIGLAISILLGLLISKDNLNPDPVTFKDLPERNIAPNYAIISPTDLPDSLHDFIEKVNTVLGKTLKEELGRDAISHKFTSTAEYNQWIYDRIVRNESLYLVVGVDFSQNGIIVSYNGTSGQVLPTLLLQVYRTLWESGDFGKLEVRHASLNRRLARLLDQILPLFIMISLMGYFSVVARLTTDDVKSARRNYLVGCGLKLPIFWFANFIIDYVIWLIFFFITFMVFRFGLDQPSYSLYPGFIVWSFMICGISVILFTYVLSFICTDPETSSTVVMLLSLFAVLILDIITTLLDGKGEDVLPWIMTWIPLTNLFTSLTTAGSLSQGDVGIPFNELWSATTTQPLLIGHLFNILIYVCVIWLIEFLRNLIAAKIAEKHFRKHLPSIAAPEITEEAIAIGQEAQDMTKDFAIRIRNVSRVFLDETNKPIVAVNNVSLGVKHGSLFGFLGANGAGKTTLMKLITKEIPPSSGFVEVDGKVAICPQFNTHLTNEMTIEEHFKFFSFIFGLQRNDAEHKQEQFIQELVLQEHLGKQMQTLSGGNARKLAIAITLLSRAHVVLLDEPTSSLDPLARHAAQRLINSFRGQKTMMLCTHLLAEAEELCDSISIMLKGSIYVVGAPSYLSAKFGTEWRLDVLFSVPTDGKFWYFLQSQIPSTKLIIHRQSNEIYSIPSSAIPMVGLFRLMDDAISNPEFAIKFFTASSATLEKVFMELVMRSEAAEQGIIVPEIHPVP
jgi:ABC-type multidrug transport system ATPase subunit